MDLSTNKYSQPSSTLFSSQVDATTVESNNGVLCNNNTTTTSMKNPFLDSFPDPFCKLNLKETSDFVKKSFPSSGRGSSAIPTNNGVTKRNFLEAPSTPGRPVFSFSSNTNSNSYSGKCFPSKWDDAEKWLVSGSSCNGSPANNNGVSLFKGLESSRMYSRQCSGYKPQMGEIFAEKSRITEERVSKVISAINGVVLSAPADVLLKDKFPNELNFKHSEPMQEKFLFGNNVQKPTISEPNQRISQHKAKHRDVGTEMTPLGSSTTSRCPTPFKSTSPARHTTPADRSGPLGPPSSDDDNNNIDISAQLQEYHLAKLHFGAQFDLAASNWSSREEEEEDVSKSLRHFEMGSEHRKSASASRGCVWEEEEKTKSCLRYQREEAKIQAWVNLQSAKAEAESRKLEVKIQKMRANLEEKLMKRMADVHRKAEEWRATAQFQHSEQVRKAGQLALEAINKKKISSHFSGHKYSCGCLPCNK